MSPNKLNIKRSKDRSVAASFEAEIWEKTIIENKMCTTLIRQATVFTT